MSELGFANGAYHIIVIIVAVWGILTGYRKGLLRQTGGVLGVAFGIVAARSLAPEFLPMVDHWLPPLITGFKRDFLLQTLTVGMIYLVSYSFVQACCIPINKLMIFLGGGIINKLAGAVFRTFKYLLMISILYNIIIDICPDTGLAKSSRLHDGNVVEGVIQIAPAVLGFPGGEEVAFRQQLEDAKKIS